MEARKDTHKTIAELTNLLNRCRDEYYNKNTPSVSDADYDRLFDELAIAESIREFIRRKILCGITVHSKEISCMMRIASCIINLSGGAVNMAEWKPANGNVFQNLPISDNFM